jgi:cytochrome b561
VLFAGVHLPAILPQSDVLHALLWDAHFYLAFVFFALILLHVAAALFHALVRRDGVFDAMAPTPVHVFGFLDYRRGQSGSSQASSEVVSRKN